MARLIVPRGLLPARETQYFCGFGPVAEWGHLRHQAAPRPPKKVPLFSAATRQAELGQPVLVFANKPSKAKIVSPVGPTGFLSGLSHFGVFAQANLLKFGETDAKVFTTERGWVAGSSQRVAGRNADSKEWLGGRSQLQVAWTSLSGSVWRGNTRPPLSGSSPVFPSLRRASIGRVPQQAVLQSDLQTARRESNQNVRIRPIS